MNSSKILRLANQFEAKLQKKAFVPMLLPAIMSVLAPVLKPYGEEAVVAVKEKLKNLKEFSVVKVTNIVLDTLNTLYGPKAITGMKEQLSGILENIPGL